MTSIYLSAAQPRWTAENEADIQDALINGLITESHYLDLKEAPATKGDNKEAARDMASFAIDGGTLIVGVAEDKDNRTFTLSPQPLNGLAEKMEQIARSIPDPPLSVLTQEIGSDADLTRGYLIVHIPASPAAPHMVDGRYYGRGDKTKYVLPDPEVVRLHERRRNADRGALVLLQHEIDNDPIPADQRQRAHLFLLAQPLAGPADLLLDLTSAPSWNTDLAAFIEKAYTSEVNAALAGMDPSPSLTAASNGFRHARGVARATHNLRAGRIFTPTSEHSPERVVELQIHEDGGLRLFFSCLSDLRQNDPVSEAEQVIYEMVAVAYTRRFLALVLAAGEHAGYFGNWAFAVGATGVKGLRVAPGRHGFWDDSPRYNQDTYTAATEVTWAELNQTPGAITRRLIGAAAVAAGRPLCAGQCAHQPVFGAGAADRPPGAGDAARLGSDRLRRAHRGRPARAVVGQGRPPPRPRPLPRGPGAKAGRVAGGDRARAGPGRGPVHPGAR